jgi:hypothetical protein
MTTEDFNRRYPEFEFRTMLRKQPPPQLVEIYHNLENWLGDEGEMFKRQPNADPKYHVFWFKDSKHATIFSLKWA